MLMWMLMLMLMLAMMMVLLMLMMMMNDDEGIDIKLGSYESGCQLAGRCFITGTHSQSGSTCDDLNMIHDALQCIAMCHVMCRVDQEMIW